MKCSAPHSLWTTKTCPKIVVHFQNHNLQDTVSVLAVLILQYIKLIAKFKFASTVVLDGVCVCSRVKEGERRNSLCHNVNNFKLNHMRHLYLWNAICLSHHQELPPLSILSFLAFSLKISGSFYYLFICLSLEPRSYQHIFFQKDSFFPKKILMLDGKLKYFPLHSICVIIHISKQSQSHYFILLSQWWMYEGYNMNKEIEA